MTPADAAELLALAAAFDRRKVGKADALAWADALADLDMSDCAEAIRAHFRESTEYLMPAHVRRGVRAIRADRIRSTNAALLEPHDVDPNDVIRYLEAGRARRAAIASGAAVDVEPVPATTRPVKELIASTAARLPEMPPAFPQEDNKPKRRKASS